MVQIKNETLFDNVRKEIVFDGMSLWLYGIHLGNVSDELRFCCPIDKDSLDEEKRIKLGNVLGEV